MQYDPLTLRQEMIALLGRIIGDGPLPADLQRTALRLFAALIGQPDSVALHGDEAQVKALDFGAAGLAGAAPAAANRRLVYVHGICQHAERFSDPWWEALRPFAPAAFGPGDLGTTRLEVVWSDLVNEAAAALAALASPAGAPSPEETDRQTAAGEIKEALRDRADQHMLNAGAGMDGVAEAPMAAGEAGSLINIPGVRCVDDFSIYLTNDGMRQQIIDRFIRVVRPEMQAGRDLDVVGHSWGSVVAYEGLRLLEDQGFSSVRVRNFFTVGAALSIGPVKSRLRPANRDGKRPANVRRWVNLDARGDIVGGPLKGRPFQVDMDFVNLMPVGCGSFLGLINPSCAHSSYFQSDNLAVNRDIFGQQMNSA